MPPLPAIDPRPAARDSEKITINLGPVDLGTVDLLVREGFYANRTDLIRSAIRKELERHAASVARAVERHGHDLGLRRLERAELEALRAAGEALHLSVVGLVVIAPDVPAALARATIASLRVLGALQASPEVRAALADRLR